MMKRPGPDERPGNNGTHDLPPSLVKAASLLHPPYPIRALAKKRKREDCKQEAPPALLFCDGHRNPVFFQNASQAANPPGPSPISITYTMGTYGSFESVPVISLQPQLSVQPVGIRQNTERQTFANNGQGQVEQSWSVPGRINCGLNLMPPEPEPVTIKLPTAPPNEVENEVSSISQL